jgi:hypothetical protein
VSFHPEVLEAPQTAALEHSGRLLRFPAEMFDRYRRKLEIQKVGYSP